MNAPHPPTGDRIAREIEQEMQEHLYRLRHVALAPSEYYVYLHPDDFQHIELVVSRIVLDVQTCLNALVKRLNRPSAWSRFIRLSNAPIEIPPAGWSVHILPALNNDVAPGQLGIQSRLSVPSQTAYGSGAGTVRISQTVVSGTDRRTVVSQESAQPVSAAAGAVAAAGPAAGAAAGEIVSTAPGSRPGPGGARLNYSDERGAHVFFISKDLIKIGRGGEAHWVDLTLLTGPKISREHCHIRRDPAGRFFLRDVSAWGTRLNGQPLDRYTEGHPTAPEYALADGASILLADELALEFRSR